MGVLEVLGASLAAMAAVSAAIFALATRDGRLKVSSESAHARIMKGEEYETVLSIQSRGGGWIGATTTSFSVETGQLAEVEPLSDGAKVRLRFVGRYSGRSQGVRVGVSLTDPLRLFHRFDQSLTSELLLDTLPLSLLAPELGRRLEVVGYGERSTGHAGQGQELYKLDEYNPGYTKDIVWRRVAESPEEVLVARMREANVRDIVKVGVVRFAERQGDERAAWTDMLCEALGELGREVLETGAAVAILFHQGSAGTGAQQASGEERIRGMTSVEAEDVNELAEGVMAASAARSSREVEAVVLESDLIVTGLRELEDESVAMLLAEKPLLLVQEAASPPPSLVERSVVWTGTGDLLPLVRKTLER